MTSLVRLTSPTARDRLRQSGVVVGGMAFAKWEAFTQTRVKECPCASCQAMAATPEEVFLLAAMAGAAPQTEAEASALLILQQTSGWNPEKGDSDGNV